MPTNLELLKSIHSNGGEFEKYEGWVNYHRRDDVAIEEDRLSFKDSADVYRIPSVEEVEKKIVELLPQDKHIFRIEHKIEIREEWIYSVYYDGGYFRGASAHESRLTAGLMLWDKLQKEKK